VRFGAVEDIRDGLALVRRQGSDVDERLHLLIARGRDDGAAIGVADEDDRSGHAFERAVECRDIIAKRRQRQRRRNHRDAVGGNRPDDLCPA
jgi:hypothetical protein